MYCCALPYFTFQVGDGKNEELWKLSQKHVTAQAARDSHAMVERWERGL